MEDDPASINTKILNIRDTLSKLSRAMKSTEPASTDSPAFPFSLNPSYPAYHPPAERDSVVVRQELREGSQHSGENSYRSEGPDQPRFTLEDYIQPRADSPLRSYRDGNLQTLLREDSTFFRTGVSATPQSEQPQRRDLVEDLRERLGGKERELRAERDNFGKLQEQLTSIKAAFREAKLTSERDSETHKLELERERRYRSQLDSDLRQARSDLEEAKSQLRQRPSAPEKSLKLDLQSLHSRLEETAKLKIELLSENADLHKVVQSKDLEVVKLREEIRTVRQREEGGREEGQSSELKASQKEVLRLKRENEELKAKEARLERDILGLEKTISDLKYTREDTKPSDDITEMTTRISELEAKLLKSSSENDNLYLELSSRPTHKQLKEKDRLIEDLRSELLTTLKSRRLKDTHSVSPRHHSSHRPRSDTDSDADLLVAEVMAALHVASRQEVVGKINHLRKAKSTSRKLLTRLSALVIECSPKGAYCGAPSSKDIWKWTRRLAEEYMSLRQSHEAQQVNSDLISEVLELLGLVYPSEVPKGVEQLLGENKLMRDVLERTKVRLSISPRATLEEMADVLSSPS